MVFNLNSFNNNNTEYHQHYRTYFGRQNKRHSYNNLWNFNKDTKYFALTFKINLGKKENK